MSFPFPGESGDSSLVVSLEINSVVYQGVLFAQQDKADKEVAQQKENNRIS